MVLNFLDSFALRQVSYLGGALRAVVGRVPGAELAGSILVAGACLVFGAAVIAIVAGMI